MGLKLLAPLVAAVALATPSAYLQSQQQADGSWGLAADDGVGCTRPERRGRRHRRRAGLSRCARSPSCQSRPRSRSPQVAEAALGRDPKQLLARLPAKPDAVNSAVWQIFALRQSGRAAPRALVSYVRASQARNGGFPWMRGVGSRLESHSWAVQALRASGVRGKPIARALAFLRGLQAPDGGYRLVAGRAPDAQSTALVIQAFVAAGIKPPSSAFAFLAKLRRADGSYRYSRAYATTPVWVTAQVLPALVKRPFPLR